MSPNRVTPVLRLAIARRMQRKFDEAEAVVHRMLAAYPADLSLLLESGLLDVAQNNKESDREKFAEMLSLDPTNTLAKQYAAQP